MTIRRISWQGELYVSVEEAASCYGIEVLEVERWVEAQLVPAPRAIEGTDALPAQALERLAALVRYTRLLGLDVATVRLLLEAGALDPERG